MSSIKCIVETPKGSNAKYNYNPQLGHYELAKLLPVGLAFPYDFGYIPGTKGDDGDPLDVIIVSEFPSFPGCILDCRIIGAIKAMQYEDMNGGVRNDRYLAIPQASVLYRDIPDLRQLPGNISEELEQFFINYNKEDGKFFKPLSYVKTKKALKMIEMPAPQNLLNWYSYCCLSPTTKAKSFRRNYMQRSAKNWHTASVA